MSATAARILRRPEELDALAPAWWALWRRASGATPFQSPAWLIPWWRHFAPGELFAVAVARGERLVGLAPFYVEDGALGRRLLPLGISVSDYHDVLLDPDDVTAAGAALVAAAFAAGGWDLWDLEELMPNAAALDLPAPAGAGEHSADHSPCPTLALEGEDLMAMLPRRMQRTLRLARNRAARAGPLAFQRAGPDGIADALATWTGCMRHAGRAGAKPASSPMRGCAASIARRLPRSRSPACYAFSPSGSGSEVVAASYGFHHAHRSYLYVTGFDPAHRVREPRRPDDRACDRGGDPGRRPRVPLPARPGALQVSLGRGRPLEPRRSLVRTCARDSAA